MRYPWANTALLFLIVAQLATGFGGLITGSDDRRWILWLHGIGGFAILLVLRWKAAIVVDAIRRYPKLDVPRLAFITLSALVLAVLGTGLYWIFVGPASLLGFSVITIHAVLALALVPLLIWHVLARRFIFRAEGATGRRAFLRLSGITIGGLVLWRLANSVPAAMVLPGSKRRFTGSYETGSFTGRFPVVSWLFDFPSAIDAERWQLTVDGAVERSLSFTYADLEQLATDVVPGLLDCTGGWYSTQEWQGVSVARLLAMAGVKATAQSVSFEAVSGYGRRFPLADAEAYLLALRVAGQPLDHGHGYPVRLVAPDRRGFDWVKWVRRIQVHESSALLQPPLPLQ